MRGSKVSGLLLTLVLTLTACRKTDAAAIHGNKLQSAVVVGTVYCDTCFQQDFSRSSHFISGAAVVVECKEWDASYQREVRTDENGDFKVKLPFSVPKHVKKLESCSVKLMSSGEAACSAASPATSSFQLKSRKDGAHFFSAGSLTFKPLKRPEACREGKPSVRDLKELETPKTEIPVIGGDIPTVPQIPNLPPLPQLPPLPVPPLPSIPKLPPPLARKSAHIKTESTAGDSKAHKSSILPPIPFLPPIPNPFQPPAVLPPNPLQPPPLLPPNPLLPPPTPLIPNPFQPPPSPLIPNPLQPPPSPLIPFPPIPGLTPSPPPPPAFPFPLPPFPIPPFPGVPPAASNSQKTPPSP